MSLKSAKMPRLGDKLEEKPVEKKKVEKKVESGYQKKEII